MFAGKFRQLLLCCVVSAMSTSGVMASVYSVDWMQLQPTPFNSAPPFNSTYNLPGIGNVQLTYTAHGDFTESRLAVPALQNGSLSYAGDTYQWGPQEVLARTNFAFSGVTNSAWFATFTFPNTIPAGDLVLGVTGLGRRNPTNPGETFVDTTTLLTVAQNGTHFGDWTGAQNYGPTQFSPAAGSFTMINSLTGNGGADPWWNTGLALVRIDDAVSSLTVRIDQTSGDGMGLNIGRIVPEPGTLGLLLTGGLCTLVRRRR